MTSELESDRITAFWNYFSAHFGQFDEWPADKDIEPLMEQFTVELHKVAPLLWEIRPGSDKPWLLIVSGFADKERVRMAEQIVAQAPSLTRWEFCDAFPKADVLNSQRNVLLDDEEDTTVEAFYWRYILQAAKNGPPDLIVEAANVINLPVEEQQRLAQNYLIDLLGERRRMREIGKIKVVGKLSNELSTGADYLRRIGRE